MIPAERTLQALQAFHDGELGWWGCQVMKWRLRSSPELRRELGELEELGGLLRQLDLQRSEHPTPELWTEISTGLLSRSRRAAPKARGFRLTPWVRLPEASSLSAGIHKCL